MPWRGMRKVDHRAQHLPRDRNAVVYSMHGFWVIKDAAEALRAKGINAAVLDGGMSAWRALGLPTDPL